LKKIGLFNRLCDDKRFGTLCAAEFRSRQLSTVHKQYNISYNDQKTILISKHWFKRTSMGGNVPETAPHALDETRPIVSS